MDEQEKRELALEIYYTYETSATNFTADLFRLIVKADTLNKMKLAAIFPEHVTLLQEFHNTPTADEFYRKYKVGPHKE